MLIYPVCRSVSFSPLEPFAGKDSSIDLQFSRYSIAFAVSLHYTSRQSLTADEINPTCFLPVSAHRYCMNWLLKSSCSETMLTFRDRSHKMHEAFLCLVCYSTSLLLVFKNAVSKTKSSRTTVSKTTIFRNYSLQDSLLDYRDDMQVSLTLKHTLK